MHLSILSLLPAVAMTVQLYNLAIWMPTMPTPEPPPITSTSWPGFILARPTRIFHDVMPTIETAAASLNETLSATFTTLTSGRCVYCENPPQSGPVWNPQMLLSVQSYSLPEVHASHTLQLMLECEATLSPTFSLWTSEPTSTTVPATSLPEM